MSEATLKQHLRLMSLMKKLSSTEAEFKNSVYFNLYNTATFETQIRFLLIENI